MPYRPWFDRGAEENILIKGGLMGVELWVKCVLKALCGSFSLMGCMFYVSGEFAFGLALPGETVGLWWVLSTSTKAHGEREKHTDLVTIS